MPRRRKDPVMAPIDGDRSRDRVLNKAPGFTYKWLSADDIPEFKSMGYVREERSTDAARPVFDVGAETNEAGYRTGSLTLFKAPDAIAQHWERTALEEAEMRMATIRSDAKRQGGKFTSQVQR